MILLSVGLNLSITKEKATLEIMVLFQRQLIWTGASFRVVLYPPSLLFVCAIEVLAILIRSNDQIKGLKYKKVQTFLV